jgi:DNA-binding NarL/FixJ family response regulator
VLFVRVGIQAPFIERDTERVLRYAAMCGHIVRSGYQREKAQSARGSTGAAEPGTTELIARLSNTEHRVLQRLRLRETERQAAQALGRSHNTIHVHVKSIYRKLRVSNRNELLCLIDQVDDGNHPLPAQQPQAHLD